MDHLRLSAVVSRVVAWHNRHPLARRITAAQVHGVGYVALPFTAPAPAASGPTAAQAAAEAIAAAAAAPLPVLTETADALPAHGEAGGEPGVPNAAGPAADAAGHERSRLRERALARARELAALPPETQAQRIADEQAAAVLATLAPALLKADFSEDFIDPLAPRQVARFALKHGSVLVRLPADGPVRLVQADSLLPGAKSAAGRVLARVVLLTAVVETDTRKSRVLLGGGLQPAVLGRRILSTPRLAAVAALGAGVVGLPLWIWRPAAVATPVATAAAGHAAAASAARPAVAATATTAAATAPAASAAMLPAAAASAPELAGVSGAPPAMAAAVPEAPPQAPLHASTPPSTHAPTHPPSPHEVPIAPTGAGAAPGAGAAEAGAGSGSRAPRVSIVPPLTDEEKARAREARAALRPAATAAATGAAAASSSAPSPAAAPAAAAASATAAAAAAVPVAPTPAPPRVWRPGPTLKRQPGDAEAAAAALASPRATAPATTPAAAPAPAAGPVFAITTRPLRTRAEADQVRVAMLSLLRTLGHDNLQVEVLPQGDDWRVVALPFPRRAAADQGRTLLVSRGMRVEVVDF